jgi:fructose-1,6-bisphosphatase II / sedoheptulose-1,7-bisphosphatase
MINQSANVNSDTLNPNIACIAKNVTQVAASASYHFIGKGDETAADAAAVEAMREELSRSDIAAKIVIGEGERDEAPMLYIGEKLGAGNLKVDIAVDPLEGTTICAHGAPNSMSVIAIARDGGLLFAPDTYMEKIAIGCGHGHDIVDLDYSPKQNLKNLAKFKNCDVRELSVCVLKRERHEELIAKLREEGARVILITDGDIAAAIATTSDRAGVDMYYGIGGAPEGVLAAAALSCVAGQMRCRLVFRNDEEKKRAISMGITDMNQQYEIEDMIRTDVVFAATGVTSGWLLDGVRHNSNYEELSTIVMQRSKKSVSFTKDRYYH